MLAALKEEIKGAVADAKTAADAAIKVADQAKAALGEKAKKAFDASKDAATKQLERFKKASAEFDLAPKVKDLTGFLADLDKEGSYADELRKLAAAAVAEQAKLVKEGKTNAAIAINKNGAKAILAGSKLLETLEAKATKLENMLDGAVDAGLATASKLANAALDHADKIMDEAAANHDDFTDAASQMSTAAADGAKQIKTKRAEERAARRARFEHPLRAGDRHHVVGPRDPQEAVDGVDHVVRVCAMRRGWVGVMHVSSSRASRAPDAAKRSTRAAMGGG